MSSTQYTIPKTQIAAVVSSAGAPLEIKTDFPVPQPQDLKPGECLVKMDCTGVCHTDLHAAKGDWPLPAKTPLVGGHEVCRAVRGCCGGADLSRRASVSS